MDTQNVMQNDAAETRAIKLVARLSIRLPKPVRQAGSRHILFKSSDALSDIATEHGASVSDIKKSKVKFDVRVSRNSA